MTGFGPRLQPDDVPRPARERRPRREAPAREGELTPERQAAETVGTWAAQRAYRLGAEHEQARLRDPQEGYGLGHDVGYSANTEDRAYVHAVIRGFEHGSQARHQLTERLLGQSRQVKPQVQPEPEAEAG